MKKTNRRTATITAAKNSENFMNPRSVEFKSCVDTQNQRIIENVRKRLLAEAQHGEVRVIMRNGQYV